MTDIFGNKLEVGDFVVHLRDSDTRLYRIVAFMPTNSNTDKVLLSSHYLSDVSNTQEYYDISKALYEIKGIKYGNVYHACNLAKTFKPSWYPLPISDKDFNYVNDIKQRYGL